MFLLAGAFWFPLLISFPHLAHHCALEKRKEYKPPKQSDYKVQVQNLPLIGLVFEDSFLSSLSFSSPAKRFNKADIAGQWQEQIRPSVLGRCPAHQHVLSPQVSNDLLAVVETL